MSTDVIEIVNLSKSYGSLQVLRGLNLRVAKGEVYGLLGPNGAGKSTLMHLLLGFLRPSSGSLRVLGSPDPDRMRAQIGYIPERQRYHTRYTAREYLRFIGEFSGLGGAELRERVDRDLAAMGLAEAADRSLGTFSKGMLQRVGVAQALLGDPQLLLIDEPSSGLDPGGQREMIELLIAVRERGHSVLLCTHYLHEVEQLCDRVGVLAGGRLAAEADVRPLRAPGNSVLIEVSAMELELRRQIEHLGKGIRCETHTVRISQNTPQLQADVLRLLLDAAVAIIALEPLESPLERLYVRAVRGEDQAPLFGQDEALAWSAPLSAPSVTTAPGERRSDGDTLLNELLRRNNDPEPDTLRQEPEP